MGLSLRVRDRILITSFAIVVGFVGFFALTQLGFVSGTIGGIHVSEIAACWHGVAAAQVLVPIVIRGTAALGRAVTATAGLCAMVLLLYVLAGLPLRDF